MYIYICMYVYIYMYIYICTFIWTTQMSFAVGLNKATSNCLVPFRRLPCSLYIWTPSIMASLSRNVYPKRVYQSITKEHFGWLNMYLSVSVDRWCCMIHQTSDLANTGHWGRLYLSRCCERAQPGIKETFVFLLLEPLCDSNPGWTDSRQGLGISYLQLSHRILHNFRAFGRLNLCVSQKLSQKKKMNDVI